MRCAQCGLIVEAPGSKPELVYALMAAHEESYHNNDQERVKTALTLAKSMAFGFINGASPRRKDARSLVEQCSRLLSEPIPAMEESSDESASPTSATGGDTEKPPDSSDTGKPSRANKKAK